MNNRKIIIAGGSGFIGQALVEHFAKENHVVVLTRKSVHAVNNRAKFELLSGANGYNVTYWRWDGITVEKHWCQELEGADLLINLSGRSVNCRYNSKNKREILGSRINPTITLGKAILGCAKPPALWLNASSATIYRHAEDRPQDEYTGEIHNDFSVQVCKNWEQSFFEQSTPLTRKIALRTAITLGQGGVMIPYLNLVKYGLGGKQGSGKQMYSWIHIQDVCSIIEFLFHNTSLNGVINCSSPYPVTNKKFMQILRETTGAKIGLPAPVPMLKLGAFLIGTESELLLKSRWVLPTKLLESGYKFKYPDLSAALREIVSKFGGVTGNVRAEPIGPNLEMI